MQSHRPRSDPQLHRCLTNPQTQEQKVPSPGGGCVPSPGGGGCVTRLRAIACVSRNTQRKESQKNDEKSAFSTSDVGHTNSLQLSYKDNDSFLHIVQNVRDRVEIGCDLSHMTELSERNPKVHSQNIKFSEQYDKYFLHPNYSLHNLTCLLTRRILSPFKRLT